MVSIGTGLKSVLSAPRACSLLFSCVLAGFSFLLGRFVSSPLEDTQGHEENRKEIPSGLEEGHDHAKHHDH